jgi:xanthine dehydrogenase YagS FAD-binding subunit
MQPFEYAKPTTKEQAARLLAAEGTGGSTVLAGGSDLLALMKDRVETPSRLVDLKSIEELRGIHWEPKTGLRVGALVTIDELAANAADAANAANSAVRREYPILARAADHVAGPQIRHVATVGGNLCQRPRCWYFRNGFGLLPMRDGRSMVTDGDNRYHAILGNDGPASFVQPSTLAPLLIALSAGVTLFGPQGERRLDLGSFYRIPSRDGEREHDLKPGEIVTWLTVPPASGRKVASYEVRQRQTLDWSLATAAVVLDMNGQTVREARVVLGQVAPVPWVAREAQDFLRGKTIDEGVAEKAGEAAVQGAKALSHNRYKIQLAKTAVKRALLAAARSEA